MRSVTRRTKIEMIYDILTACMIEQRLTHLLNLTNLNYKYAKPLIELLIKHGFLEIVAMERAGHGSEKGYKTTDKGTKEIKEIRTFYTKFKNAS